MKRREHTVYKRQNTRYTINSSTPTANCSQQSLIVLFTTSPEHESAMTITTNDSSPDAAVRINSQSTFRRRNQHRTKKLRVNSSLLKTMTHDTTRETQSPVATRILSHEFENVRSTTQADCPIRLQLSLQLANTATIISSLRLFHEYICDCITVAMSEYICD